MSRDGATDPVWEAGFRNHFVHTGSPLLTLCWTPKRVTRRRSLSPSSFPFLLDLNSDQGTSAVFNETVRSVTDFIFLGSKITADSDFSHNIKRRLLLGIKAMTNLDVILKSRDITLLTKIHLIKAMVFPVAMYGCDSWTIKKAECQEIDVFKLWYWRRLLRPLGHQGDQTSQS